MGLRDVSCSIPRFKMNPNTPNISKKVAKRTGTVLQVTIDLFNEWTKL